MMTWTAYWKWLEMALLIGVKSPQDLVSLRASAAIQAPVAIGEPKQ